MAGFSKVGGKDTETKDRVISSLALVAGDLVMASKSAGTVVKATSTTTISLLQGGGIVVGATTTSDTKVLIQDIEFGATYIVECAATANASHNYQRMLLTDENTVNNTGTDESTYPVFMQTGVIDSTHIKGEFIRALT